MATQTKYPKRIVENVSALNTRFGPNAMTIARKWLNSTMGEVFKDVSLDDFGSLDDVIEKFENDVEVSNELSKPLPLEVKLKLAIYEEEEVNESSTPASWSDLEEEITVAASLGLKILASELIEEKLYNLTNFMNTNHLDWSQMSDEQWDGWEDQGVVSKEKIYLGEHWFYDPKKNPDLDEDLLNTEMFIYEDTGLKLKLYFLVQD